MIKASSRHLAAGTRVRVSRPGPVPSGSTWDDDGHRTSNHVKRRLQQLFFKADKRIHAEIVFVASETERERLRRAGMTKVQLRDPAGSMIVISAPVDLLQRA